MKHNTLFTFAKTIFVATSVSVLIGCSSSGKKNTPAVMDEALATGVNSVIDFNDTLPGSEDEKKLPPAAGTTAVEPLSPGKTLNNSVYWKLTEAIKIQNDEMIVKESTQILLKNPGDLRALNAMAMSSYRKGRFTLARYLLNKANQVHPNSAEVYSNLGVVDLATDNKRDAIQNFKKAMQLNSEDGVAAANIGSLYVRERDYAKARVALEVAYRKGFRDAKTLNNYAIALAANAKYDKANEIYEEVLRQQPSSKEALFNSSVLLIEHLKKYNEGLDRLQKLKFTGGPADSKNKIIALENKAKAGLK